MDRHRIALHAHHVGPRAREAVARLVDALGDASAGDFDEAGIVEVELPAESFERALERVFDAVALSGVDDELVFAEHPSVPDHWRRVGYASG